MTNALACRPCSEGEHLDCEERTPYEPEEPSVADLIEAIFGGPVSACCCEPRDGFLLEEEFNGSS